MKKKRTLNEYRQTAGVDSNKVTKNYKTIPEYDPYTGEKNPYYEELTKDGTFEINEIDSERAVEIVNGATWSETECNNVQRFQFGDFPEIIYVIKTGFKNKYIVVNEDAYELQIGETKLMTKDKVEKMYNIKLSI